jgi:hypothetical protein
MPETVAREQTSPTQAEEAPSAASAQEDSTPPEQTAGEPETPSTATKQRRTRKPKKAAKDGRVAARPPPDRPRGPTRASCRWRRTVRRWGARRDVGERGRVRGLSHRSTSAAG